MVESTETTTPTRALFAALGVTLCGILFTVLFGYLASELLATLGNDVADSPMLREDIVQVSIFAFSMLGLLVAGAVYSWWSGIEVTEEWTSSDDIRVVLGGVVLSAMLAMAGFALLDWLDVHLASEWLTQTGESALLLLACVSVVVVAPCEEYLFRGIVQERLARDMQTWVAILLAGILFGGFQLVHYTGDPVAVWLAAALMGGIGMILGGLYEITENLTVSILVHGFINVILLLLLHVDIGAL